MQNNTTTNGTNGTTNSNNSSDYTDDSDHQQPTLADLMAAYQERRAADIERQKLATEARIAESITHLRTQVEQQLSPELRAALQLDYRRSVQRYGWGDAEAYFSIDGVPWSLWRDSEDWHITGPKDYKRTIWPLDDAAVLGAISEYPAWQEQQRQKVEKAALRQAEAAKRPKLYTFATGSEETAFLQSGRSVTVYMNTGEVRGTVADVRKHWLLLTLPSGESQILINQRQILSISPDDPQQLETAQAEQQAEQRPDK